MHEAFFPRLHADNDAIALTEDEQRYSYSELHARVNRCARGFIGERNSLAEERVAFLMPASLDYATVLLAVWRAGGIAVPLNVASATSELEHYLGCAGVHRLVANTEYQSPALRDLCAAMDVELVTVEALLIEGSEPLPSPTSTDRALMVFTSGTTNKPKGVISTHGIVRAQIETLLEAWAWSDSDRSRCFCRCIMCTASSMYCAVRSGPARALTSTQSSISLRSQIVSARTATACLWRCRPFT
jgi:malonyl-CoA/methylmalonyl-CoA synthetase